MTQQEFNEMLAVAIAQGLGGGTYISRFDGEEIDTGLSKLLLPGGIVTPDLADGSVTTPKLADGAVDWGKLAAEARPIRTQLLDNAWWANPDAIIDQRNGYIIPAGTPIYSDPGLTQLIGPASVPCPVVTRTSTYVEVAEPNNLAQHYYAQPGTAVRGYCQAGYTIDRWRTWDNRVTITLTTNGLNIEMSSTPENPNLISPLVQYLEFERFPPNSPLTASVLVGDNLLVSTGSTAAGVPEVSMQGIYMGCAKETTGFAFYLSVKNGT